MVKVGYVKGTCPRCGRVRGAPRPVDAVVCDCWEYCPNDHGRGAYGTIMIEYTPDMAPQTYGPIVSETASGDLDHPMYILRVCPICRYHSAQKPIEVRLT